MDRNALTSAVFAELKHVKDFSELDKARIAASISDRFRLKGEDVKVEPIPGSGFEPVFYDLRHEQDFTYPGDKRKVKKTAAGKVVRRKPEEVDGIVLHQVAVEFSVSRHQVAASGGDAKLALARRALDAACHVFAFRAGIFVAAHDLEIYVQHGNGFNRRSLGIEIDGRYCGIEDDPSTAAREDLRSTWNGTPTEWTEQTSDTTKAALTWMITEGRKLGMPLRYYWAHRQSSDTRRSDPGQSIWEDIGPWLEDVHGLEPQPTLVLGTGAPIPKQWDSRSLAAY